MKNILLLFFVLMGTIAWAQINPVHEYTFNNCNGVDSRNGTDGIIQGISDCPCGVDGFALNFNIQSQRADFPQIINKRLSSDFTFSFYMWPMSSETGTQGVELLSIGEECMPDSIFQIRYFPINGEIRVRYSDQERNGVELIGFLSGQYCWSYVAIVKEETEFKLYIDNEEVDKIFFPVLPSFQSSDGLSISVGTCVGQPGVIQYEGLFDELRIYDKALTMSDIKQEDYFPNQIIEDKHIIFKGGSVLLETGEVCSPNFEWKPSEGLNDVELLNPIASPEESTFYTLTVNDRGCKVTDEINVIVVDVDALDCSQLLLPSAFTPNGDGVNDRFGISNGFIMDELISFEVFDKWGGRMYYATESNPEWDGNFRNNPVMPGPYLYRVRYVCSGEESQRNGVINVIR